MKISRSTKTWAGVVATAMIIGGVALAAPAGAVDGVPTPTSSCTLTPAEQAAKQAANQADRSARQAANQAVRADRQASNQADRSARQAANQADRQADGTCTLTDADRAAKQAANQADRIAGVKQGNQGGKGNVRK